MRWVLVVAGILLCVACEGLKLHVRVPSPTGVVAEEHRFEYHPSQERLDICAARICNAINNSCVDETFLQISAQLRALSNEEMKSTSVQAVSFPEESTKDVYLFLHIPKTAGTSMVGYFQAESGCSVSKVASSDGAIPCPSLAFLYDKTFQNASSWVEEIELMPKLLHKQLLGMLAEGCSCPRELTTNHGKTMLVGHYEMPHFIRLSGQKKALTLLREPVARIKSLYAYFRRMLEAGLLGNTLQAQGIREILEQPLVDVYRKYGGSGETASISHYTARVFFNGMIRTFVSVKRPTLGLGFERTEADCVDFARCDLNGYLKDAMDVIDLYFIAVGVQEAFVDSMLHFVAVTKFFQHPVERKNVTVQLLREEPFRQSAAKELRELDEAIIWSYNRLDALLFLHFARSFIDVGPIRAKYARYAQLLTAAGLQTEV